MQSNTKYICKHLKTKVCILNENENKDKPEQNNDKSEENKPKSVRKKPVKKDVEKEEINYSYLRMPDNEILIELEKEYFKND